MRTENVSLSLDNDFLSGSQDVAESRKLSSHSRALYLQLQHDRLARLLAELEREAGPIRAEAVEEARQAWLAAEEIKHFSNSIPER